MKKLIIALAAVLTFAGCSDFLEPLPNGHYTDKNLLEYPSMIRGFVEKSYDLLPKLYSGGEYVYLDGATDDAVITAQTHAMRRFAVGTGTPASDPFKTFWIRDYRAIMYVNKFLKDRLGINTRYMIDNEQNRRLQRALQGDAYALRAWYQFDLLRKWGGRGTDGRLLGFPILLEPVDVFDADAGLVRTRHLRTMRGTNPERLRFGAGLPARSQPRLAGRRHLGAGRRTLGTASTASP